MDVEVPIGMLKKKKVGEKKKFGNISLYFSVFSVHFGYVKPQQKFFTPYAY